MKRFVLSCCILAATSTMVFAQAAKTSPSKSKNTTAAASQKSADWDFLSKVNEFKAGLDRGNEDMAKQRFEDLKQSMTKDMAALKPKIAHAATDAEKSKMAELMQKKVNIYSDIMSAANDMKGNKDLMVKKYKEYGATL